MDDIRGIMPALNLPILEPKMTAVPVEEQRQEIKLS